MSSTKKVKSVVKTSTTKNNSSTRPWQGTVLTVFAIINFIFLVMLIPFILLIILGGGMLGFMENLEPGIAMLVGGGGLILLLGLLPFGILDIFMIRGFLKGQKWSIVLSLIFSTMSLIGMIFDFTLFSLILIGFLMYLEVTCLMHPFYGGKK